MINDAKPLFKIINKQWYKRRQLLKEPALPVKVDIPDYQAIHNHFCTMNVEFSDGSLKSLIARVIYNKLTKEWTVDGMEVAVRVEDTVD